MSFPTWDNNTCVKQVSPAQKAFYQDQGYLKFGRIFTADEMQTLGEHVDEMTANLPEGKRPEELDVPHFADPWLFRYLCDPRVLDVMEGLLGPDLVLWSSHFIAKPKGNGKAVPWHTDGSYWNKRLKPMKVATLWLAVDESVVENGCMRVIPGTHSDVQRLLDEYEDVDPRGNVFSSRIKNELVDEASSVDLELQVGECHFHDAWTIHGSNPNFSAKRRCGYTMRYMPASAFHDAPPESTHKIYLVRGEDRTEGRNRYSPVPDFEPLPGALKN